MNRIDVSKYGFPLEGGGMCGVFACGITDYLLDHQIAFPYAIGVSAGAAIHLPKISGDAACIRE